MFGELAANWAMWASLVIVLASIGFYMIDRWSMETVSAAIILSLLLLFEMPGATGANGQAISAADILSGFGNPALITIMALLVVGQGLFQTGALDGPTKMLLSSYDKQPIMTLIGAFAAVFATSAFINNTPVIIMFLPIMSAIAQRMGASTSKIMMPLSFVGVFAGMTTLIGTSTNLLAADVYERLTMDMLGFFELTSLGLVLAAVGVIYVVLTARFLLPSRVGLTDEIASSSGKQYVAQIEVGFDHFLNGKSPVAGMFQDLPNMTVRMIQRGEQAMLPPFDDDEVTLQPGDLVIVAATRQVLSDTLAKQPDLLKQMWRASGGDETSSITPRSLMLAEAVIAPGSRMAGRTVELIGFRRLTKSVVLGIQRRSRMIRTQLGEIRLEAGDTLLLCAPPESFAELRTSRDIILLEWSSTEIPVTARALMARLLTVGTVALAAFNILPILHASLLGAVTMILTGCLNFRQATRSLDLRIFLLIAAALAMGVALELTGAADMIANAVVAAAEPYGTLAVLSAIFLAVAILTNIVSNAATAVLFTPVALAAANKLGADPLPFVLAVIYAANCCYATPIAYQTNLLVMGPGHYRFSDFMKFGGPLVIIMWVTFTLAAPWRFDL